MSSTTVRVIRCDVCGYGGAWTQPETFTRLGAVDLCWWCADPRAKVWIETGGHRVTFDAGSWQCSCGTTYGSVVLSLRLRGVPLSVLDAVPSLTNATAHVHLEGQR